MNQFMALYGVNIKHGELTICVIGQSGGKTVLSPGDFGDLTSKNGHLNR